MVLASECDVIHESPGPNAARRQTACLWVVPAHPGAAHSVGRPGLDPGTLGLKAQVKA